MAKCWNTTRSDDGVLFVTLDVPDRSVNAFSQAVIKELGELVSTIESDASLRGVIFKSGKKGTFIVGADVEEMKEIESAEQARQFVSRGQQIFERLSRVKTPTVALISGPCLGGGLEFALACRYPSPTTAARPSWACRKSGWASSRAGGAPSACRSRSACSRRCA